MSSALTRRALRRTCTSARWPPAWASSFSAKNHHTAGPTLPPKKMRSLVSLYHRAETFVTPENLDQAIDHAFIASSTTSFMDQSFEDISYRDLASISSQRKFLPKIAAAPSAAAMRQSNPAYTMPFSDFKSRREARVTEALFGAERRRPGLAIVEEEAERIKS